tara:strand:+ start:72 stop:368 length:297 start_codon:yes stop_codon:yes gene_type:complete
MPKPLKPYVKVGTKEWEVFVPRPPKFATHAVLTCFNQTYNDGKPKTATVLIRDFGTFDGVSGDFHYIRMNKQGKVQEEYDKVWYWDGKQVEGLEVDND